MEKNRKIKLITMMALIVAVVGMSIGFAVFSNVLTISSSATVTPNEDDFKMTIYGCVDPEEVNAIYDELPSDLTKWSTTNAKEIFHLLYPDNNITGTTVTDAMIDNNKITISNIDIEFTKTAPAFYFFAVKNEGAYDAYVTFPDIFNTENVQTGTCTAGEGATPALVEAACDSVFLTVQGFSPDYGEIGTNGATHKLAIGEHFIFAFQVSYDADATSSRADGPFSVQFEPIELEFSTAPPASS